MKGKELTAYDKWLTRRKWRTGEIISPEKAADLYLAEHPLPPAKGAENCWNCGIDLRNAPDGVTKHHCICGATDPGERQQQPTAEGAEEWIKNLTELRINMQDLMLYYSKSGHDFTTPVIDILLEMREKCLDGSVIYSKIKSTVLWYPAKFIDWVNDNFYWDKGLDGYLPTTIKHQGMTFKTTDELLIYWAKDKHYSYHRKPMSNGLLPL